MNEIANKLKQEVVLVISLLLAIITSITTRPKVEYIDFKVLILLFTLMLLVKAFEELKIMDKLALTILNKYKSSRKVSLVLIGLTFFSSMLVTNDVALITFVPLTIIIGNKSGFKVMKSIIFQTLAANIGSSLTPMGNPQNLFLFSYYQLNAVEFFKVTLPFTLIGAVWLIILNSRIEGKHLEFSLEDIKIKNKKKAIIYGILFILTILSVFNFLDYRIIFIAVVITALILDRVLIKQVDYFLLLTFVCFFIFIGNLSNMEIVHEYIGGFLVSKVNTYFSAIFLSQAISNVPCAILLSGFTENWKEVLLGVDIGGMGTLIASLASVISYKLYVNTYPNKSKEYLFKFSIYNVISVLIFALINYFIFI